MNWIVVMQYPESCLSQKITFFSLNYFKGLRSTKTIQNQSKPFWEILKLSLGA